MYRSNAEAIPSFGNYVTKFFTGPRETKEKLVGRSKDVKVRRISYAAAISRDRDSFGQLIASREMKRYLSELSKMTMKIKYIFYDL